MKVLTIRQPWAWAVCHAGKRCENRAWLRSPSLLAVARSLVGQRFAVHAGAGTGTREAAHAAALDVIRIVGPACDAFVSAGGRWLPAPSLPRGAIVATARIDVLCQTTVGGHRLALDSHDARSCMLCRVGGWVPPATCPNADPWAIPGTVGLILADVRVLPVPVPCKGAQGWWTIPDGAPCGERGGE